MLTLNGHANDRSRRSRTRHIVSPSNEAELVYNIGMIDEILRKELERLENIKPEDKKKLTQKEKLIINKSIKVIKLLLAI